MADPFIAEIRIFPFNFAPRGWAWCNGQLLPIRQNTALFALLGTTYGGDGRSTFGLPNLQGRAAVQPGQGAGLSLHHLGQKGGTETVTLLESEMPVHPHGLQASPDPGDNTVPGPTVSLAGSVGGSVYADGTVPPAAAAPTALAPTGGGQPHNNVQPYLTLFFCIALQGIFPPRP